MSNSSDNQEDFTLLWLDETLDTENNDLREVSKIRQVVNYLKTYVDSKQCQNYIQLHVHENIILVVSGTLGQHIVPNIHDLIQIKRIYIFCCNKDLHVEWAQTYKKVNDNIFTQTEKLIEILKPEVRQCQQYLLIQKAIVDVHNKTSDFKWARLLADTLIRLPREPIAKVEMMKTLRTHYHDNPNTLQFIDTFEKNEKNESAVTWYTKEGCLYQIVNRIFREEQIDEIYQYREFIKELSEELNQLYVQQIQNYRDWGLSIITTYRGAGIGRHDIDILQSNKGDLISFNGFLSTSPDEELAFGFARGAIGSSDLTAVLFKFIIDINLTTTGFAEVTELSAFQRSEREVLFNLSAIFKIDQVEYDDENRMWRVDLSLCEKYFLIGQHYYVEMKESPLTRTNSSLEDFVLFLLEAGLIEKAEQFINKLLSKHNNNEDTNVDYYNALGLLFFRKGDYTGALQNNQKALDILKASLPEKHPDIARIYNDIGTLYYHKGDYDNAFKYCKKALDIFKETLPPTHGDIGRSYNSIGTICHHNGDYVNAINYLKQAIDIAEQTLPEMHPDIAMNSNSIALVYRDQGDYENALKFYKKSQVTFKKTLPEKHPDIAISYNNIGQVYNDKGDYENALDNYQIALDIWKQTLPEKHSNIAMGYHNIGGVYHNKGNYDNALHYYKRALDIWRETLPENHPNTAASHACIGLVYHDRGDYDDALDYNEKALDIFKQTLSETHPRIAVIYHNIGLVYRGKGDCDNALDCYKKALDIWKQSLSELHPNIARSYNNIGEVYREKGDYDNALHYCEKGLDIGKQTQPEKHPDIASSYNNIGKIYHNKSDYDKALDYYKKALDIWKQSLSEMHPNIARSYNNIGEAYRDKGDYENALHYCEKGFDILKQTLPEKHPDIASSYNNIEKIYHDKGDYDRALSYNEKALDITKQALS